MTEHVPSMQRNSGRRSFRVRGHSFLSKTWSRRPNSVITWATYLRKEIREAFVLLKGLEYLDSFLESFWGWEATLPLKDRLRIHHLESTYLSYVVPDPPTYQVWLPVSDIRNVILSGPVPPFGSVGYGRALNWFLKGLGEYEEMQELLDCEQAALNRSQLFWTAKEFEIIHYYHTLPYRPEEYYHHGRRVQRHY